MDNVEYFTIHDSENGEIALLGIKWILNGKILKVETSMLITKGDEQVFGFISDALIERLRKKKIKEMKNNSPVSIPVESNEE